MGYQIEKVEIDVHFEIENVPNVLEALRILCEQDRKYSGVHSAGVLDAVKRKDIAGALVKWRYDSRQMITDWKTVIIQIAGWTAPDQRYGDDEVLWATLAPWVQHGSRITWTAVDGERWRFSFWWGQMFIETPVTTTKTVWRRRQ